MRGWGRLLRDVLLAVVAPALVIAAVYLAPFIRNPSTMPFGFDTASYLWRTNLVHDLGVASLNPDTVGEFKALGSRPAYPVVLSILRSSTGESSLTLAWVTPALIAVLIGLGTAALAADGLREPRWRSGTVAVAVAASAFIAWTAVGYATALAFDAIAVALALVALRVAAGGRGIVGGALLLAGGALHHWMFAGVFAAMLAGFALLLAANRARRRRSGDEATSPGGARLGVMLVLSLGLAGLAFLLAPELPGRLPKVSYGGAGAITFIRDRMPSMALPITLPLAALGAILLGSTFGTKSLDHDARSLRRWGTLLLAMWASLAAVGLAGWYLLHLSIPPYRWAAFAFAIPALIVLGTQVVGQRLARRLGVPGGTAGAILSVAAVVCLAGAGAAVWWHREPRIDAEQLTQLATAAAYVQGLPEGVPIVVLIDRGVRSPQLDIVRAGLPASRIPDILTAGAKILLDGSVQQDESEAAAVPPGAVVLVLDALRRSPAIPDGTPIGPGVTLISGPAPRGPIEPGQLPRARSGPALFALCGELIAILAAAGSGWSAGLTDLGWWGSLALAPSFGLAVLGLTGMAASRLGVPLHGGWGVGVAVVTAVGGWAVWACVRRWGRPVSAGVAADAEPSRPLA
jgi:hypothetical protein